MGDVAEGMGERGGEAGSGAYFPLFPRGRFSLLVGDPGVGKSLLAAHLVARQTLRSPMPPLGFAARPVGGEVDVTKLGVEDDPGVSVICPKEDDAYTLKLRLLVGAEGRAADRRFVRVIENTSLVFRKPAPFQTEEGDPERTKCRLVAQLTRMVEDDKRRIRLLVLDPLPAFLENMDAANNAALIRRAMEPLLNFTQFYGITTIGITHLTKSGRARIPIFRAASSFAYTALARSVVLMTEDTAGGDPCRRILVPLKNSFGVARCAYGVRVESVMDEGLCDMPVPYVRFEGEVGEHALLPGNVGREEKIGDLAVEEAERFLREVLREGPMLSARVQAEARSLGIGGRTLVRARERMGAVAFRTGEGWYVELPGREVEYSI